MRGKVAKQHRMKLRSWLLITICLAVGLVLLPPIRNRIFPFAFFVDPQRLFYSPSHDQTLPHQAPDLERFPDSLDDLAIVAHYDDEALGIGGFLASEVRAGKKVGVVIVSYSDGNPTAVRNWFGTENSFHMYHWKLINHLRLLPQDFSNYAEARERETEVALDRIGIPNASRIYMRYPEKGIDTFDQQPSQTVSGDYFDPVSRSREEYTGKEFRQTLQDIIARSHPARIITHLPDDTNSFHRIVGTTVTQINAQAENPSVIWGFLTHWSAKDESWVPKEYDNEQSWLKQQPMDLFIPPTGSPRDSVVRCDSTRLAWPGDFVSWKRQLASLYTSQARLDPLMLQLFSKRNELFWEPTSQMLHEYIYDDVSLPTGSDAIQTQDGICRAGVLGVEN